VKTLAFLKGNTDHVSSHFLGKEFDCPCSVCTMTFVHEELLEKLEKLREKLGCSITIDKSGGYRCDYHQRELREKGFETAQGRSQHQDGRAADISTGRHSGLALEHAARAIGFKAVGVGTNWIHVDLRADRNYFWGYRRSTVAPVKSAAGAAPSPAPRPSASK
jgi:hypothetical protein